MNQKALKVLEYDKIIQLLAERLQMPEKNDVWNWFR